MKLDLGTVEIPDGVSGDWRVETFEISDGEARFSWLRGGLNGVEAGKYKRLMRGRTVIMSNTRMERITNREFVYEARGRVLINGLGLGMVLRAILQKPEVAYVRVIEKSVDVIALVGPYFSFDPRVEIIHADAMEYKPAKGERFDVVWHDIWENICSDNNEQMKVLHRRYGRICDWQGSWSRGLWR